MLELVSGNQGSQLYSGFLRMLEVQLFLKLNIRNDWGLIFLNSVNKHEAIMLALRQPELNILSRFYHEPSVFYLLYPEVVFGNFFCSVGATLGFFWVGCICHWKLLLVYI